MRSQFPSPAIRFLLSLACIIPGAIVLYLSVTATFDARQSHSWPSTKGTLRVIEGGRKTVDYQFTVNGITYESDQVIHGEFGNRAPSHTWFRFSDLPSGTVVDVYYDPGNPRKSVLARELDHRTSFNILWGVAFLFMGTVVLVFIPRLEAIVERGGSRSTSQNTVSPTRPENE